MPLSEDLRPDRPTLFRLARDGESLEFLFACCAVCGELTFPHASPGCRVCGASLEGLRPLVRPGIATVRDVVAVQVSLAPGMAVPVSIGRIELAPGIVEEGVLAVSPNVLPAPNSAVRAVANLSTDGKTYGCVFVPIMEVSR